MRKLILWLALIMLALTTTALAAEYYEFCEPAYAGHDSAPFCHPADQIRRESHESQ